MKNTILTTTLIALCAVQAFAEPIGSGFTYQGHLNESGHPATGRYDMLFNLYDSPSDGTVLGTFSILSAVPVTNGLFTVQLNAYGEFGTNAFNGQARWLQIAVRTNNNSVLNPWVDLSPRQPLTSTPQAAFAQNAGTADNATLAATVPDGAITASKLASGAVQADNLAAGAISWSAIKDIPPGFADGIDNGMTYTVGAGLNLNWVNEFSVDFGGSGSATSVAHSDHDHFGAKWTGNTMFGTGLSVTNSASNATGLYGQQGVGSQFPYIFGNPSGVWGESSEGTGVFGATGYTNGSGVFGFAAKTNGNNVGVAGHSASTSGMGVRGMAGAKTGKTIGVRGESASGEGTGLVGVASAIWGDATGVYGQTAAERGSGVFGKATFISGGGPNYGVKGQSDSLWGYGVYGQAASASGVNFGVVGEARSVGGVGVLARNTNGVSLRAEGSGIIQSDADSYIFIPGTAGIGAINDAAVERDAYKLTIKDNFFMDNAVHYAITVPASLYGQGTTLKSIEIIFRNLDTYYGKLTLTRLIESRGPGNSTVLINDPAPHQLYLLNHPLSANSGFLTLEMFYEIVNAEGIPGSEIYGIKVRLGHN